MFRTTVTAKNNRVRVEREMLAGAQWVLITRLSFGSVGEAVAKFPRLWRGDNIITEIGVVLPWDALSDDLLSETEERKAAS